jgi:sulfatase maturation enzyme AslB (radical SAM superfamily)
VDIEDVRLELERYSGMHRDELSDMIELLCGLRCEYCFGDEFVIALHKELRNQLRNYQEHSKIIERTITPESYTEGDLEWLD